MLLVNIVKLSSQAQGQLSWDGGQAADWATKESTSWFTDRQGGEIFLFSKTPRPATGQPQPLIQRVRRLFAWGVKRSSREANPSNEVKNDRRCTCSPTICLRGVVHKDIFACLFVAWLPSVINSFRPSTTLIARSFTFCLHTLLSRFFQMLEEPSKPSFF